MPLLAHLVTISEKPFPIYLNKLRSATPSNPTTASNRCGCCGATSYHRVVARDEAGAMRYTDTLQCSGCGREFANLEVWRQGGVQESIIPPIAAAN